MITTLGIRSARRRRRKAGLALRPADDLDLLLQEEAASDRLEYVHAREASRSIPAQIRIRRVDRDAWRSRSRLKSRSDTAYPTGQQAPRWFAVPAAALIALPLLARRRFPFAAPVALWVVAVVHLVRRWTSGRVHDCRDRSPVWLRHFCLAICLTARRPGRASLSCSVRR